MNWPTGSNHSEKVPIHQTAEHLSTNTNITTNPLQPPRDTDSSSTQDSGYSEPTPYFLIQQSTPDNEQIPKGSNSSKVGWDKNGNILFIGVERMNERACVWKENLEWYMICINKSTFD